MVLQREFRELDRKLQNMIIKATFTEILPLPHARVYRNEYVTEELVKGKGLQVSRSLGSLLEQEQSVQSEWVSSEPGEV